MSVNSHRVIPKCVLKMFSNNHDELFYYDKNKENHTSDNILITKCSAKSFNTQEGYYSEDIESFLSQNIEQELGKLLERISQFDFNNKNYQSLNNSDNDNIIRNYAKSLIVRSKLMHDGVQKKSVFSFLLSEQFINDFSVMDGMHNFLNETFINTYPLTFVYNNTPKPFILPISGLFSYTINNELFALIPLTPKIAALFVSETQIKKYIKDRIKQVLIIEDEEVLENYNAYAVNYEMKFNEGICVSGDKEYLREIIKSVIILNSLDKS